MLQSPKNRICPLLRRSICSNMPRQPRGEMNGSSPSITSTNASAAHKLLLSKATYFLAAGAALLPLPELRIDLKKSEDGSTTITSLFLVKLAL